MNQAAILEILLRSIELKDLAKRLWSIGAKETGGELQAIASVTDSIASGLDKRVISELTKDSYTPAIAIKAAGREVAVFSSNTEIMPPRNDIIELAKLKSRGRNLRHLFLHQVFRTEPGKGPFAALLVQRPTCDILLPVDDLPRQTVVIPARFGELMNSHPIYGLMAIEPGRRVLPVLNMERIETLASD
ncbi:MAG: hypothetical protein GXP49_04205 [Deltaproteobacteria bacterium]|nr:hypothetical protein [Deltaproteobacteria bacterium]